MKIINSFFALVLTLSGFLSAQTNWVRYPSNPILTNSSAGMWTDRGFPFVFIMKTDTIYKMWFTANDGEHDRVGYATSVNGINWNIHPNPVLDIGTSGSFDDEGVFGANVIYDGNTYKMWYNGYDQQPFFVSNFQVGYATSPDGINWTKFNNNPILTVGDSGHWDSFWAYSGTVLFESGTYKMWYSGFDGLNLRSGYATSTDGINWIKYSGNPVLKVTPKSWDATVAVNPNVINDGSLYLMWYNGSKNDIGTDYSVGFATSSDGINWTKFSGNPVLDLGTAGSFDSPWIWHPFVIKDNGIFKMWYSGFDGSSYKLGYAEDTSNVTEIDEERSNLLSEYNLSQNYPNPFNPVTTIRYSIPKSSQVVLKVYDVLGNEVATYVNEEKSIGNYEVEFNANNKSSGVYFYRLQAGDFVETKKMILLR